LFGDEFCAPPEDLPLQGVTDSWPFYLFIFFIVFILFVLSLILFFERGEHATIAWKYSDIQAENHHQG
jgi:hypothetical protein